jgi:large subunit ribosomal protein L15
MKLNTIRDNAGASKERMRVGRGIGSGKGKTAGRGHKGQKARTGVRIKGFEGGQMPMHRRLPKRGFVNVLAADYNEVNLGRVQAAVDAKALDAAVPVTIDALVKAGVCSKPRDGVKILGKGELKAKLAFEVVGASKSAVAAIEKAGGSVKLVTSPKAAAREAATAQKAAAKDAKAKTAPKKA